MGGAGPDRNFQKCEICTHEPSLFPRQTRHWCFEPERLWAKYSTASQWEKNIFEEVFQSILAFTFYSQIKDALSHKGSFNYLDSFYTLRQGQLHEWTEHLLQL